MTTLTLAKLAQIEAAAAKATEWIFPVADGKSIALCDPATVAALCRIARVSILLYSDDTLSAAKELPDAIRDAGLLDDKL